MSYDICKPMSPMITHTHVKITETKSGIVALNNAVNFHCDLQPNEWWWWMKESTLVNANVKHDKA